MIVHSMTATFGKLEHETLNLQPGLNIIEAPNEWGKSTWCAFLTAMLYGIETRTKSTKTALADKERYLPWSGSPMSGRMEICWQGREITIERKSKGRIPMREFAAYETASGLPIPELNAENCGQMLLGVEKSVFLRGGFIRLNDMPLTQDETLRARLNALVTTGDESGDGQRLGKALKELKNRIKFNKNGLLPQAELQKLELEAKLRELDTLEAQCTKLQLRQEEVTAWAAALENHSTYLRYEKSRQDAQRVAQAEQTCVEAEARREQARADCKGAIARDEAEQKLLQLRKLNQQALDLQMEARMRPQSPEEPDPPEPFRGMDGKQAVEKANHDAEGYEQLSKKKPIFLLALAVLLLGGVAFFWNGIAGAALAVVGVVLLIATLMDRNRRSRLRNQIADIYGTDDPDLWRQDAENWAEKWNVWQIRLEECKHDREDLLTRYEALRQRMADITAGREQEQARADWERSLAVWDALAEAEKQAERAAEYRKTVAAMAVCVMPPEGEDTLSYSESETARLISDARGELHQLNSRLNQYQGQIKMLGDREALEQAADKLQQRIGKLEDLYGAISLAMETLNDATMELQRRFAPQIAQRAQELMGAMTYGRYHRLSLGEDLSLRSGAGEEDILHDVLWRSDGTVDQLYLSLRLALAESLTPQAPLVLDDALVRFDEERLQAAMEVLAQEAKQKQVLLFTCQHREKAYFQNKEDTQ